MASIFRPTYTKTDRQTGRKVTRKARKWYVKYRDADGIVRKVPGYGDKEATRQLAAELERKAARIASGQIDRYDDHRKKPLAEHLEDYRRYLEAKSDTQTHARQTARRIRAILNGCGFKRIPDLSASRVAEWLADVRRNGFAASTSNGYLTAIKGFARWLVKDQRAPDNRLAHLSALNAKVDVRVQRRCLSAAEFDALIEAAGSGPEWRGLSGEDRAMLYLTAAHTGLRVSELASLTRASFDLDAEQPTVTVEAAYSKHRRKDIQPIRGDLAQRLRAYLAGRPREAKAWAGSWPKYDAARMLRFDLRHARAKWIKEARTNNERQERERSDYLCPTDDAGRVFDFHALRHQYITMLAKSGVNPKVVQQLARHSSITLTMDRYTHLGLVDVAGALDALPKLPGPDRGQEELRATGTDDRLVPQLVLPSDVSRRKMAPLATGGKPQTSEMAVFDSGLSLDGTTQEATSNPQVAGSSPAGRNELGYFLRSLA